MGVCMSRLRRVARVVFAATLGAGVIYSLVLVPPAGLGRSDKMLHFAGYAALTASGVTGWPRRSGRIFVIVVLFGLAMEIGQSFHPRRAFEWGDLLANVAGALSVVSALFMAHRVV